MAEIKDKEAAPGRMNLEQTLKSRDTEEFIDIWFYRPLGYRIACISEKMGLSPNSLTITSIFTGIAAGHLFYYTNPIINIIGALLLIFSNSLDSADGQLARMTNTTSRLGRFLDGMSSYFWFVSIYINLAFRISGGGFSSWVFVLMFVIGICHSLQAMMADYYRNAHLFFAHGKSRSEVDSAAGLEAQYRALGPDDSFVEKMFLNLYLQYTRRQEAIGTRLVELYNYVSRRWNDNPPELLRAHFREASLPLMKYCNILTTNTRMIALFLAVFINRPIQYFLFELTVLNMILLYLVTRHQEICRRTIENIESYN